MRSAQERAFAEHVILEMREGELWLQCSCVAGDTPALNSANLMSETQTLFLSGFGHSHDPSCPMHRVFKSDEDATRAGTRKAAGTKRLNYRDFYLPTSRKRPSRHPASRSTQVRTELAADAGRDSHGCF